MNSKRERNSSDTPVKQTNMTPVLPVKNSMYSQCRRLGLSKRKISTSPAAIENTSNKLSPVQSSSKVESPSVNTTVTPIRLSTSRVKQQTNLPVKRKLDDKKCYSSEGNTSLNNSIVNNSSVYKQRSLKFVDIFNIESNQDLPKTSNKSTDFNVNKQYKFEINNKEKKIVLKCTNSNVAAVEKDKNKAIEPKSKEPAKLITKLQKNNNKSGIEYEISPESKIHTDTKQKKAFERIKYDRKRKKDQISNKNKDFKDNKTSPSKHKKSSKEYVAYSLPETSKYVVNENISSSNSDADVDNKCNKNLRITITRLDINNQTTINLKNTKFDDYTKKTENTNNSNNDTSASTKSDDELSIETKKYKSNRKSRKSERSDERKKESKRKHKSKRLHDKVKKMKHNSSSPDLNETRSSCSSKESLNLPIDSVDNSPQVDNENCTVSESPKEIELSITEDLKQAYDTKLNKETELIFDLSTQLDSEKSVLQTDKRIEYISPSPETIPIKKRKLRENETSENSIENKFDTSIDNNEKKNDSLVTDVNEMPPTSENLITLPIINDTQNNINLGTSSSSNVNNEIIENIQTKDSLENTNPTMDDRKAEETEIKNTTESLISVEEKEKFNQNGTDDLNLITSVNNINLLNTKSVNTKCDINKCNSIQLINNQEIIKENLESETTGHKVNDKDKIETKKKIRRSRTKKDGTDSIENPLIESVNDNDSLLCRYNFKKTRTKQVMDYSEYLSSEDSIESVKPVRKRGRPRKHEPLYLTSNLKTDAQPNKIETEETNCPNVNDTKPKPIRRRSSASVSKDSIELYVDEDSMPLSERIDKNKRNQKGDLINPETFKISEKNIATRKRKTSEVYYKEDSVSSIEEFLVKDDEVVNNISNIEKPTTFSRLLDKIEERASPNSIYTFREESEEKLTLEELRMKRKQNNKINKNNSLDEIRPCNSPQESLNYNKIELDTSNDYVERESKYTNKTSVKRSTVENRRNNAFRWNSRAINNFRGNSEPFGSRRVANYRTKRLPCRFNIIASVHEPNIRNNKEENNSLGNPDINYSIEPDVTAGPSRSNIELDIITNGINNELDMINNGIHNELEIINNETQSNTVQINVNEPPSVASSEPQSVASIEPPSVAPSESPSVTPSEPPNIAQNEPPNITPSEPPNIAPNEPLNLASSVSQNIPLRVSICEKEIPILGVDLNNEIVDADLINEIVIGRSIEIPNSEVSCITDVDLMNPTDFQDLRTIAAILGTNVKTKVIVNGVISKSTDQFQPNVSEISTAAEDVFHMPQTNNVSVPNLHKLQKIMNEYQETINHFEKNITEESPENYVIQKDETLDNIPINILDVPAADNKEVNVPENQEGNEENKNVNLDANSSVFYTPSVSDEERTSEEVINKNLSNENVNDQITENNLSAFIKDMVQSNSDLLLLNEDISQQEADKNEEMIENELNTSCDNINKEILENNIFVVINNIEDLTNSHNNFENTSLIENIGDYDELEVVNEDKFEITIENKNECKTINGDEITNKNKNETENINGDIINENRNECENINGDVVINENQNECKNINGDVVINENQNESENRNGDEITIKNQNECETRNDEIIIDKNERESIMEDQITNENKNEPETINTEIIINKNEIETIKEHENTKEQNNHITNKNENNILNENNITYDNKNENEITIENRKEHEITVEIRNERETTVENRNEREITNKNKNDCVIITNEDEHEITNKNENEITNENKNENEITNENKNECHVPKENEIINDTENNSPSKNTVSENSKITRIDNNLHKRNTITGLGGSKENSVSLNASTNHSNKNVMDRDELSINDIWNVIGCSSNYNRSIDNSEIIAIASTSKANDEESRKARRNLHMNSKKRNRKRNRNRKKMKYALNTDIIRRLTRSRTINKPVNKDATTEITNKNIKKQIGNKDTINEIANEDSIIDITTDDTINERANNDFVIEIPDEDTVRDSTNKKTRRRNKNKDNTEETTVIDITEDINDKDTTNEMINIDLTNENESESQPVLRRRIRQYRGKNSVQIPSPTPDLSEPTTSTIVCEGLFDEDSMSYLERLEEDMNNISEPSSSIDESNKKSEPPPIRHVIVDRQNRKISPRIIPYKLNDKHTLITLHVNNTVQYIKINNNINYIKSTNNQKDSQSPVNNEDKNDSKVKKIKDCDLELKDIKNNSQDNIDEKPKQMMKDEIKNADVKGIIETVTGSNENLNNQTPGVNNLIVYKHRHEKGRVTIQKEIEQAKTLIKNRNTSLTKTEISSIFDPVIYNLDSYMYNQSRPILPFTIQGRKAYYKNCVAEVIKLKALEQIKLNILKKLHICMQYQEEDKEKKKEVRKYREAAQRALMELAAELRVDSELPFTMDTLLNNLQIPFDIVGYDEVLDFFTL